MKYRSKQLGADIRAGKVCATQQGRAPLASLITTAAALFLGSASALADDLKVVATIKPVHALVAQVLDGIATPALLVDGRASPHSFALKPSDARALEGADVVVRVGPSVEPFTERIAETLSAGTQLVTLTEAPGVTLLKMRTGTTFEAHAHHDAAQNEHEAAHAREHENKGDHTNEHAHDTHADSDEHHDHGTGGIDGHIWLDPDNAKAIVRHVADVLAARKPELKDRLQANVAKSIDGIDALDRDVTAATASAKGKPFIVFHDAYQYFETHYGLQAVGAITLNPEVKPSARRLMEIRATITGTKAACVFAEPQFSPRIIDTVIEGTSAKAGTLDPLGADIPPGPAHYAATMRTLAKAMSVCFGS